MGGLFGVGIIGCGGIAHRHLEAWQASPDLCEVRALADPHLDALQALHNKIPQAAAYADYRSVLGRSDIDAVDVLTPPGLHWPVARDAIEAGKDVIIIKPLTVELSHADRLIALARERKVRLMAGQPRRFEPSLIKARELIQAGTIGRVARFYSRGFMRVEWLDKATDWFSNLAMSGGITIENIVHQTDALAWLGGPVASVYGLAGTFHTAAWPGGGLPDDQISFMMQFESGALGLIEGGAARPAGGPQYMFEVVGTEGGITLDRGALIIGRGAKEYDSYSERFEFSGGPSEPAMVRAFLNAIKEDLPVPTQAEEGRYAVELCWAALQSAREGRVVKLPLDPTNYPSFSADESGS